MRPKSIVFISLLSLSAKHVMAFSLSDHQHIMQQAALDVSRCYPNALSLDDQALLTTADQEEDLNIFKKDTHYSHYFNPEKIIKMRFRVTSDHRVLKLSLKHSLRSLAYISHHIEDMATPMHVIPISHDYSDGFEEKVKINADLSTHLTCVEMASLALEKTSFIEILRLTAENTLQSLRHDFLTGTVLNFESGVGDQQTQIPLNWFWQEGVGENFGKYGILGNTYGEEDIKTKKYEVKISKQEFADYKIKRLKFATLATVRTLLFGLSLDEK